MLTKEFLLKEGFKHNPYGPNTLNEYEKEVDCGHIYIRFNEGRAVGMYIYTERPNVDIRKIVLSDTDVTKEDYELAKQLCRVK